MHFLIIKIHFLLHTYVNLNNSAYYYNKVMCMHICRKPNIDITMQI